MSFSCVIGGACYHRASDTTSMCPVQTQAVFVCYSLWLTRLWQMSNIFQTVLSAIHHRVEGTLKEAGGGLVATAHVYS